MRLRIAAAFAAVGFVLAGCGGSTASPSPSGPTSGRTPGPQDHTWNFEIEEVGLGESGYITLQNYTDIASNLDALYLCQADRCVGLPDAVVEPGAVARIAVGDGEGLEAVVMTRVNLELTPADGEIGLYVSEDVQNTADLRAYIQWGLTPHELTDVADKAGLWRKAGFAPSGPNATRLWKTEANLWVWDPGI